MGAVGIHDGGIALAAIGTHIPHTRVSNEDSEHLQGAKADFLTNKIGVSSRAVKAPEQSTSDLCVAAFNDLTDRVAPDPADIELACVVTQNPDMRIPHTAAILHEKLGLSERCMTFDISQGCSGYVHGLAVVISLADRLSLRNAVLFTCDPYTTIVDPRDRNTALIFGDAATASYLTVGSSGYQLVDADFGTVPGTASVLRCDTGHLFMNGRAVFMNAAHRIPACIARILERNDLDIADIDLFLLHPGSRRMIDVLRKEIGVDESRLPFEIQDYGNTVSSSIPLMLASRLRENPPTTLLMCGFGVGFTWGTSLARFAKKKEAQ